MLEDELPAWDEIDRDLVQQHADKTGSAWARGRAGCWRIGTRRAIVFGRLFQNEPAQPEWTGQWVDMMHTDSRAIYLLDTHRLEVTAWELNKYLPNY